jgi:hypothetical protein
MISDAKSTDQKSNGTKPVQAKEGPGAEESEDGERGCRRNEERRKRDIEEDELKKYRGGRGVKGI